MVRVPLSHDAAAEDVLARLADGDPLAQAFARALAEGRLPPARPGRRSTYTRAIAEAWCHLVADGCTIREAASHPGMPSIGTIYRWLDMQPEFRRLYALALWRRESRRAEQAGTCGDGSEVC